VAEGVEDGALATALLSLGCDMAQGFWLSRPVAPEEMKALLGLGPAATPEHCFTIPEPRGGVERRSANSLLRAVEA
jgi:predicted signal transduction protein with EAL and GGDEF domain